MKYRMFILLIIIFISCDTKENRLKHFIEGWQKREILFPDNLYLKIQGRDTCISQLWESKYKILNYLDSSSCTSCQAKFSEWTLLQNKIDSLHINASIIFIVGVNDFQEFEQLQKLHIFNIPCIYDYEHNIVKDNQLPTIPGLQTFLLDSINHVLLVGNPIESNKIQRLYIKIMQQ